LWFHYVEFYTRLRPALEMHQIQREFEESCDPVALSAVLESREAIHDATQFLRRLGALAHFDWCKNWDLARALRVIFTSARVDDPLLDVGCGWWGGMLLPTLRRYGYRKLYGCDPLLPLTARIAGIQYLKRDFFDMDFPNHSIRFVIALSVIEHGIVLSDFLREAHRLLAPGGFLILSTDYWHEGVMRSAQRPFGVPWRIFTRQDVETLLRLSAEMGFVVPRDLRLEGISKVVSWLGLSYTFIFLVMRKRG
jgi:SAM-dependent methyltransferase